MKRPLFGWILALLLITSAAFGVSNALAEDDDKEEDGKSSDHRKDREERQEDNAERDAAEARENGSGHKPGRLAEENGSFDGRYVDFRLDMATCTIQDFRVYNHSFFSAIELGGSCEKDTEKKGSKLDVEGENGEVRIHDNPNGLIRFEADDEGTLVFRFATGATVNGTGRELNVTVGNLSARLFLNGNHSFTLGNGTASVEDARGNFIVHPAQKESEDGKKVREALHKGKIGGQIDVLVDNGTIVHETMTFDNVTIRADHKNDTFRFLIDGNLTGGRVFIVNIPPKAFDKDRVGVRYYDVDKVGFPVEVHIAEANNLSDVLDVAAGEGPEYWVIRDADGTHVLVAVPHFSVHIFEVMGVAPQVVPLVVYGLVFGLLFVAVGALGMFLRRGRSAA